jgi:DNA-binding HxlR family transcriptional regulator
MLSDTKNSAEVRVLTSSSSKARDKAFMQNPFHDSDRTLARVCSVARTVEILSDAWMFLVLRESFFGARRFEQFQSRLRLPRSTLVLRLGKLCKLGLLSKQGYSTASSRFEYRLTDRGRALYPTMLALLQFGDRWLTGEASAPPLQLNHLACGHVCSPLVTCSHCHSVVEPKHVTYRPGPGSSDLGNDLSQVHPSYQPAKVAVRSRRASDPRLLEKVRPCSVARSLQIIGDRWSFLVIREMFFGTTRFDDFVAKLGIASNILTDRLQRLTQFEIASKQRYQDKPERFEYRFTKKGRDLYGAMIVMMRWGDQWLSGGKPPLILHHETCRHDFYAEVTCSECRQALVAQEMSYAMRYSIEDLAVRR